MILKVNNLKKSYGDHIIFDKFNMEVKSGEFIAIEGKSGAGKSTLLNMIGLLDQQDDGDIILFGEKNIKPFTKKAELFLKYHIGYLFQNFALLDDKTVYYNMMLALENHKINDKSKKIKEALNLVGLSGYENKKNFKCSGGEQQRVSIARLMIKPCDIILADEPTGSLDENNKMIVFSLLKELQKMGKTIIVVSHDSALIKLADRSIFI